MKWHMVVPGEYELRHEGQRLASVSKIGHNWYWWLAGWDGTRGIPESTCGFAQDRAEAMIRSGPRNPRA
jgi:hypothetical protein